METKLEVGQRREVEATVTEEMTARAMKSGGLRVLATPAMVALMEQAAFTLAEEHMEEGCTTVGTALNIEHVSATPVGLLVRAEAVVTAIEGRKLTFELRASDEAGEIGRGVHERFIVQAEKFQAKADSKK